LGSAERGRFPLLTAATLAATNLIDCQLIDYIWRLPRIDQDLTQRRKSREGALRIAVGILRLRAFA
jgi:hypothetical protein